VISVLVVDDHELVRNGIKSLLAGENGIKVIGEAATGEEAIRLTKEMKPDIVLMDVKMPGIGGLEATHKLIRANPEVKVLVVTAFQEDPFPSRLLQAGAAGYLTKESSSDEMVHAIRSVHSGQRYVSASIAQQVILSRLNMEPGKCPFELLSDRELEVMLMITRGVKVQEISEKLCLSPKTVNSYRYRIFDKLGIQSDVELTHLAFRHGLLGDEVIG